MQAFRAPGIADLYVVFELVSVFVVSQFFCDAVKDFIEKDFENEDVGLFVHGLDEHGHINVWVEDEDGKNGKRVFDVIIENIGRKSFFLSHIKFFKLTMDLVVKSHRQTKDKAFFKIDFEPEFTE